MLYTNFPQSLGSSMIWQLESNSTFKLFQLKRFHTKLRQFLKDTVDRISSLGIQLQIQHFSLLKTTNIFNK